MDVDEDPIGQSTSSEPASSKSKRLKHSVEDPLLIEMRKKFDNAQSELASVRTAFSVTEPVTEQTAFLDWVREVCKNVSEDRQVSFSCKPAGNDKSVPLRWHTVHLHPTAQVCQHLPLAAQVCHRPVNVISRCQVTGECHRHIFRVLPLGRASPRNTCKLTCSSLIPTLLQARQVRHRLYRLLF